MPVVPINLAIDASGDDLMVTPGVVLEVGQIATQVMTPPAPQFSAADYLAAIQSLMPRGRVWPKDPASLQTQVLAGIVPTYVRSNQAAANLIADLFPATAVDFISEWEATLGLPDPCAGLAPTLQLRQAQVVGKLTNAGGQSVGYFEGIALALGYPVTITEFTGASVHHFQVNTPTVSLIYFRAGVGCAGEPLVTGGSAVLECLINELKPAHTTATFHYG